MIGPLRALIRTVLIGVSAAALLALPAIPASAATSDSSANLACTITVTTDVHPGVTPQLRHLAVTSHGLTGTATCTGTINGQPVTGPGRFKVTNQLVGNCTQATGQGEFVLRIPTTGGTRTVAGTFDISPGVGGAPALTGDLTGTSRVTALLEGDCVTTPLTRTTAELDVHVT
jgi:hypothetical protein